MSTQKNPKGLQIQTGFKGGRAKASKVDQAALSLLAEYEQVSLSEAARLSIREASQRRGLWDKALASDICSNGPVTHQDGL